LKKVFPCFIFYKVKENINLFYIVSFRGIYIFSLELGLLGLYFVMNYLNFLAEVFLGVSSECDSSCLRMTKQIPLFFVMLFQHFGRCSSIVSRTSEIMVLVPSSSRYIFYKIALSLFHKKHSK
jgi:hypothetical protein